MAQTLKNELGITAASPRIIGDARLSDFRALWKTGRYHAAIYMSGYALEACLKCAICKNLKLDQLPKVFEYHDLESLLLFSGLEAELYLDAKRRESFEGLLNDWSVEMRYVDPENSKFNFGLCAEVDTWLNDVGFGLLPWLRSRS